MTTTSNFRNEAKRFQQEFQESAHKIWLAGLGAFSTLEERGGDYFQQLVERGEKFESRSKDELKKTRKRVESSFEEGRERVEGKVKDARKRVETSVEDAFSGLDERLTDVLHRFGVPTRDEIHALTRRVEELNQKVDELQGVAGTRKVLHVVPAEEGWKVEAEGAAKATSVHGTKDEAVQAAREIAQAERPSQLIVHKKDGTFQNETTYDVEETN